MTVQLSAPLAEWVDASQLDWVVPALREERVAHLLRALPKALRRPLMPLHLAAREIAEHVPLSGGSLRRGHVGLRPPQVRRRNPARGMAGRRPARSSPATHPDRLDRRRGAGGGARSRRLARAGAEPPDPGGSRGLATGRAAMGTTRPPGLELRRSARGDHRRRDRRVPIAGIPGSANARKGTSRCGCSGRSRKPRPPRGLRVPRLAERVLHRELVGVAEGPPQPARAWCAPRHAWVGGRPDRNGLAEPASAPAARTRTAAAHPRRPSRHTSDVRPRPPDRARGTAGRAWWVRSSRSGRKCSCAVVRSRACRPS